MGKKLPWFPFYYLDWLSDSEVAMMTYSEKGLFIDMLARCFNEDGLPADEKKLIRLFKCDLEDLRECVKLFYKSDEKLFNKKLDLIKKEQRKVSRDKSKAGKASAEARAAKRLKETTGVQQVLNSVKTESQQNPTNTTQQNRTQQNIKSKPKKAFKKPTLQEVFDYCQERKNRVDANNFINHYEANGWKVGRNSMKDWKAAVRTWEKNSYNQQQTNSPYGNLG